MRVQNKVFYKTKDEAPSPLPFRGNNLEPRWRGCNLKAQRSYQNLAGDERICYPFRINNLEPRWRGCNLKARRACQIIAGGERSVTPGKSVLILSHPEGVAESFK